MKANTYVYCIQEQSRDAFAPIKVGIAIRAQERLDNLQVGNPMPLGIYGLIGPFTRLQAGRMENDLHIAMSKHRIRGEWFSGRALPYFDEVQAMHAKTAAQDAINDVCANGFNVGNQRYPQANGAQ